MVRRAVQPRAVAPCARSADQHSSGLRGALGLPTWGSQAGVYRPHKHAVDDLVLLKEISNATIASALQDHYRNDEIYVQARQRGRARVECTRSDACGPV